MKKKFVILTLCISLLASSAVACNNSTPATTKTQSQTETESQTESQTPDTTETQNNSDEAEEAFTKCMQAIYDVQAGAAGASLRAETAVDELKNFAATYAADSTSSDITNYANKWFEEMEKDNESVRSDFAECLDTTVDVAYENDSSLESDEYFQKVKSAIKDAFK